MSDIRLAHGDCLEVMPMLEDRSVDMILADLPYGTTACSWDIRIPFEPLWTQYKRLIRPRGAIVLFGSQPFTTLLIASNMAWFKYCWVWDKVSPVDFLNVNRRPMRQHEDIAVFSDGQGMYNPQNSGKAGSQYQQSSRASQNYGEYGDDVKRSVGYPRDIIKFRRVQPVYGDEPTGHPTQKPVALLEYLIRTYTNAGDTVLDNTMGSGSTMVACVNTERNGIGIELDATYYETANRRVNAAQAQLRMPL